MNRIIKAVFQHKKILIILAVVIVIVIIIICLIKTDKIGTSTPIYKTVAVTKGDLSTVINASGEIESENQATLTFLTSGRTSYLGFSVGDSVKRGQVIASLDSTQAYEAYSKAEASFKSAQSSLNKVLDDIHLAQYGNGGFSNVGSSNETMTQKNLREAAEMARDASYQDLQSARKNLEWSTIVAPFDGIISDISGIMVGQNVSAGSPGKITLVGSGKLKFVANVDEIDFSKLVASQSAEILLDAYPDEKFNGSITQIGVSAIKLATGGSVIPVDVSLPESNKFKSGLNGEINVTVTTKKDVLVLPNSAVRKNGDERFVYLQVDKKIEKRIIIVGEVLGSQTEIMSGISEGDLVIMGEYPK